MMRRTALAIAAAAALSAGAASAVRAQDSTLPPGGIVPTTMTLSRLLALHKRAVGKLDAGTADTSVAVLAYRDGPLSGTETDYTSGENERRDIVLGGFQSSYGTLNGKSWEHNRNGLTRMMTGLHARDDVNAAMLRHAAASSAHVHLLGEIRTPSPAYIVTLDPPDGRLEYVYYDASKYLITREETFEEGHRLTDTFEDFRATKGVRQAWHMHRTSGLPDNDADWKMQTLTVGEAVDPSKLAIVPSVSTLSFSGDRITLPAKFSGDRIILTVQLGRHKVNLQMDSGASGILLNRDVADATGVRSFGTRTEETAGTYTASDALIPKIDFGDATMENVAAETAPYEDETYEGTPVAGLIGYDFIAGAIMHIDYYDSKVEAIAPSAFQAPQGAIALPIRLDDGVPVISAHVGSAQGDHFIVDTGADRSMIFSAFAAAHPADVVDQGLGESITAAYPYVAHIYGVGGKVEVRPVQVPSLSFAGVTFPKWLFDVSHDAAAFEGDDYDGLIGQDVLRNFDVYFDYAHAMMYLVPNDRYKQRWG